MPAPTGDDILSDSPQTDQLLWEFNGPAPDGVTPFRTQLRLFGTSDWSVPSPSSSLNNVEAAGLDPGTCEWPVQWFSGSAAGLPSEWSDSTHQLVA